MLKIYIRLKTMSGGDKKMNLGEMILDALKFPFSNLKRAAGLLLLFLGSILIIPAIMASGYVFRVIRHTSNGSNELPPFDELGELFTDGLKYIATTITYIIIPSILTLVLFYGTSRSVYSGNFQIGTYLLSVVVGLIIALPFDLVYIIALGNMAHEGRFGASFEFNKIFGFIGKIGWPKYFVYVLVFILIELLLSQISSFGLLMRIPFGLYGLFAGIILYLLISIYLSLYRGRFIGLIYLKGSHSIKNGQKTEGDLESKENQNIGTA